MEENWVYVGIFLDDKSKKKLKKLFKKPDGFWNEYYDHMTVVFNDGSDVADAIKSINSENIGKKFKLKVIGVGISEKAYAVKVQVPAGVVCANKITHITMACEYDGAPVDSNYITNWNEIYEDLYVTGKMEIYAGDNSNVVFKSSKSNEANIME